MIRPDPVRLSEARKAVLSEQYDEGGIGTLSEKSLHKILKFYFEPRGACHEIPVSGVIADIKNEQGITEIQTGSFERIREKLVRLLPEYHVNVVYPVITDRRLIWLDPETGELTVPKKSPKHGRPSHVLVELYHISDLLADENLTVTAVFLTADEYRYLDGRGPTRTKGATKLQVIPNEITGLAVISSVEELASLLPDSLPDEFTRKEFDRATGLRGRNAFYAIKCLTDRRIIERAGSRGRAYLYKRN